jgi:MipA family protein
MSSAGPGEPPEPIRAACLALALLVAPAQATRAQEPEEAGKPLLEAGIVGVAAYVPDYPAASQNHMRYIAFPYVVYRGDIFQVTERGRLRGVLLDTRRFEFDLSAAAAFATDSDDNDAREGMPDLDWLAEIGPRLGILLHGTPESGLLRLDLQGRAVFSTDLEDFGYRGLLFNPALVWQRPDVLVDDLELSVRFSSVFATERLQDYFYEVRGRHARSGRAEYDAEGGYLGSFLDVGFRYPLTSRLRLSLGTRAGYFEGAANEDSPLFREEWNLGVSAALIVALYRSERRVGGSIDPDD